MIKWDYQKSELLIKMLYIFDYGIDMNIFSFKWVYYGEVKSNSFSKGVTVIIKFIYLSVSDGRLETCQKLGPMQGLYLAP